MTEMNPELALKLNDANNAQIEAWTAVLMSSENHLPGAMDEVNRRVNNRSYFIQLNGETVPTTALDEQAEQQKK